MISNIYVLVQKLHLKTGAVSNSENSAQIRRLFTALDKFVFSFQLQSNNFSLTN